MTRTAPLLTVACLVGSALLMGQRQSPTPRDFDELFARYNAPEPNPLGSAQVFFHYSAIQTAEITAPEIPGVVRAGTKVTMLKEVLRGAEGAIGIPDGSGDALFTERDDSKISRIDKDDKVTTYLERSEGAIALAYDHKGRLIGTRSGGGLTVLAPERAAIPMVFEGRSVQATELQIDRRDGIYVTNGPNVIYRTPEGQVIRAASGLKRTNGIQLSPDEKTLYVTSGPHWSTSEPLPVSIVIALDVQPDGTLTNARTFARTGADGMAVDAAGRLYVSVPPSSYRPDEVLGVRVFSPQGRLLGTIPTGIAPNSVGFGGPDKRTLYIVGRRSGAQKIRLLAQGVLTRAK